MAKGEEFLIIDTGGLGYRVFVGNKIWQETKEGSDVELFTETILRRDTLELYGCRSREELEFFGFLLNISGVGPKTALVLAEFGSVEKLRKELEEKGDALSRKIRGVGPKRMRKILLELTGKIQQEQPSQKAETAEAREALSALGFSRQEIQKVFSKMPSEIKETEEVVKQALALLGNTRE